MLTRITLGLVFFVFACCGGDLNGKWNAKVQTPNGEMDVTYTLKVADGKISGSVSGPMGEFPITEGNIQDDQVSFVLSVSMNGEERKVPHKGKLAGDELTLKLTLGEQEIDVNAKRAS